MTGLTLRFWRPLAGVAAMLVMWAAYAAWADHQQGIGAKAERAIWIGAVDKQRDEARKQIDAANARVVAAENAASVARNAQNLKDAQNAKITSELERKLLVAGRLRDPNVPRCGNGGAASGAASAFSPGTGTNDIPEAPGLLSADLSGLLRTVTREADEVNLAYIASRADADQLRVLLAACGMPRAAIDRALLFDPFAWQFVPQRLRAGLESRTLQRFDSLA